MRYLAFRVFFLVITLSSCSPYRHQWKRCTIKADCPCAKYVKVYLPACNTFNGIEAEFMCSNGGLRLYLNIHTLQFPCDPENYSTSTIQVSIDDNFFEYSTERLSGGQRLKLPPEACEQIVLALLEGLDIEISVGRYEGALLSTGFMKHYYAMCEFSGT